jgi:hypothetical protein
MFCRRAPDPRPARPSIRIPAFGFLKAAFSCIFLFFCKKHPARGRTRDRATKKPGAACRPAPGVVSVNTLFWKILVTRVKRKIDLPISL